MLHSCIYFSFFIVYIILSLLCSLPTPSKTQTYFCFKQMSRILTPHRLQRCGKQPSVFAQQPCTQQTPSITQPTIQQPSQQHADTIGPFTITKPKSSAPHQHQFSKEFTDSYNKRHRSTTKDAAPDPYAFLTNANYETNEIYMPENFSTANTRQLHFEHIDALNNNASHRELSENMYEDTNTTHSEYKNTLINNMTKELFATAKYLSNGDATKDGQYRYDKNDPFESPQAFRTMNLRDAQQIVNDNIPFYE